ncbi:MAG: MerR family transcriptional regulator [Cellulosilyticaceae bacterium]
MERNKRLLTSGEFAKLCHTTKMTLRHYKEIGILKPAYEGENHYSYYDVEQFYDYYGIEILKQTGTPLAEIKQCMTHQDIPQVVEVLQKQQQKLEEEQKKLEQMTFMVKNALYNITLGSEQLAEAEVPQIRNFPKEHLLALTEADLKVEEEDIHDDDRMLIAILSKYRELCELYPIQTDFQLGAILPYAQITGERPVITHIYTKLNKAHKNPYYKEKPAGKYLCVVHKGKWDVSLAYQQLAHYISSHQIQVIGDVYAYDLAGFMINGVEKNAMTMISIRVEI